MGQTGETLVPLICVALPLGSLQNLTSPAKLSSDSTSEQNGKCSLSAIDYGQSFLSDSLALIGYTSDFYLV